MKRRMIQGMRIIAYVLLAAFFMAPEALLSIWPKLVNPTDWNLIFAFAQLVCLVGAAFLHALTGPRTWAKWWVVTFFAAVLTLANFLFSMDGSSKGRSDATKEARLVMKDVRTGEERLAELKVQRRDFGSFTRTTDAEVVVAQAAHVAAQKARDTECNDGVGSNCRGREDDLKRMLAAWSDAAKANGRTKAHDAIAAEIKGLEDDLKAKDAPASADKLAANITMLLTTFGADTREEKVAPWVPLGMSLLFTLIGCVIPALIYERVLGSRPTDHVQTHPTDVQPTSNRPEPATVLPPTEMDVTPPRTKQEPLDVSFPAVGEWYATQVDVGEHLRLGAREGWKLCKAWCLTNGMTPPNEKQFGLAMKEELRVPFVTERGRGFYTISIKRTAPKLVRRA